MWADWLNTTIGEQVRLQRGIDITKAEQRAGRVPVVSSGGISSYHDTAHAKAPGVVLGRKGNVGTVFYLAEDYWPHDTSLWVTDFHGNDPRFVYYFFLNFADELKTMDVGSANPALNRNHVHPLKTTWPQKPEQRAITRVLGALDDKIELNRRMNQTLEELAAALFRSWFVDFDPVVAKAAGRKPAHLRPELAALFPASFQESSLGEIPKGWEVKKACDVYSDLFDGPHATPAVTDSGPVFLGIKNMTGTRIDLSDVRHIAESDYPRWTRRVTPSAGDIVFTYEATLGFCAIIPDGLRCCLGRRMALVRCDQRLTHFLFHTLTSDAFQTLIESRAWHGSTVNRIPLTEFPNYPMLWPGQKLAEKFGNLVQSWWSAIHHNENESRTLAALRDTLLPKLLSGELRVKPAEKLLEATA